MTATPSAAPIDAIVDELRGDHAAVAAELWDVAAELHAHPEIRFEEVRAARVLSDALEAHGFAVQRGFAGLDTAFVGRFSTPGSDASAPTIAVFCEYDALEGIGHACGHNLIAASGLGAGLVAKSALERTETPVHLVIVGSPGEEGAAGKVPMIDGGILDGVDLAIMIHPSGEDVSRTLSLSRVALDVTFEGKASHAAGAPERGINALDAATLSLTAVGLLRQQLPSSVRVHGIVTDGGQAPNIIPERSALRVFVRDDSHERLHADIVPRVSACFEGAAIATGCTVSIEQNTPAYDAMLSNEVLAQLSDAAFSAVGRAAHEPSGPLGSTDMGNVSRRVPALHPTIALLQGGSPHTREFAAAAGEAEAAAVVKDGVLILGAIAVACARDPRLVEEAASGFSPD